ncbi:hypothetical protein P153DRAFT_378167 [Dothidotthia symphoricarpi CBS 119687]|uniref:LIM zinc-binding domain-containing protein n=1 Tax=Dothidotthia symphoricarpi CBS 119687 TaxID=1392245 RepID=A0A6A6A734_9PLEO|nr:uncharacterized protein P153DRAFT_378167 [Dothidotthia symphoricarpi CBS 119687]KAF2126617.1 hypothetical protein P153DRAFT_378167 [Dothidotthia symphoricarpi CBS 119687]
MSLLPTIKCSSCGVDIDILELADHVCAPAAPSTTSTIIGPSPPPAPDSLTSPKLDRAATFGGASFSNRPVERSPSGRMPPPSRIDSRAANKPFRPLSPSPTSSYSDPRSLSPAPQRPPFSMNRSATNPMPQPTAHRSPNLLSNLDSAFPVFPVNRSATPPTQDRLDPMYNQRYAAPSPLFAPLSPRTNGGENVTRRMDNILPGPFDGRDERRPNTPASRSATPSGHRRTETQSSIADKGSMHKQRTSQGSNASRGSAYSNRSLNQANAAPATSPSFKEEQTDGIDEFLESLQQDTLTRPGQLNLENRSRTYPAPQENRQRREPPPRPRRPSTKDLPPQNIADFMPRANNMLPPAALSRSGSDSAARQNSAQPLALQSSTARSDAPLNPLQTPSDSGLSDDSYASSGFRSGASSRSSGPGSEGSHSREVSKISRPDEIVEQRVGRTASPVSRAETRPAPPQAQDRPEPRSYVIPRSLSPGYPPATAPDHLNYPESPMDPAIMMGGTFNRQPRRPSPSPSRDPALNLGQTPPKRVSDPEPRQQETRRGTPPSKGNCRGCSEPIVGKSVKDSSGRLTGRYHKQCFACRACGDPFPTAEFYVFNNAPYCEHHYHELNGSLCRACNRGIEGQYLETDSRQKFHPRCFTCATCRVVLRDDYFEVGGRKYCGRHAQHAAAPPQNYLGPGGFRPRNVQKRRTRLMMMA